MSFEEAEVLKNRAYAFLRNSKKLFSEGEYDLAAFTLEQFCQLIIKQKLLVATGTYPRTHSLIRLSRTLGKTAPQLEAEGFIQHNITYLTKIEDAYIGARYFPRKYEQKEVEELNSLRRDS